jgi:RNA polymerase sigma-70 factor (ECF subfamily)
MKVIDRDLDDAEIHALVEEARSKDPKSVATLCTTFYPKLYQYFYFRVNRIEDAEDLTNDTCLKAVEALQQQTGSFRAWIFRIASNLVTDYYRRRSVRQNVESIGASNDILHANGDRADAIVEREELKRALLHLTEEQQQVIVLKFIEGYETDEIAEMLGKSAGAIRGIQFRALIALRTMFGVEADRGKKEST